MENTTIHIIWGILGIIISEIGYLLYVREITKKEVKENWFNIKLWSILVGLLISGLLTLLIELVKDVSLSTWRIILGVIIFFLINKYIGISVAKGGRR